MPNPITTGFDAGKTFDVAAVDVTGHLGLDSSGHTFNDFYSFTGQAGDLMNFQVMSSLLMRINNSIDTTMTIFGPDGKPVPYYSSTAFNDDTFEPSDSAIIDLTLPKTGTYTVEVSMFHSTDPIFAPGGQYANPAAYNDNGTGDYELFMYRFATYNATSGDDTFVGGSGSDTFIGGDGTNTVVEAASSNFTLSGSQIIGPGTDTLVNINKVKLTDLGRNHTFTITPTWTGDTTLDGGAGSDTLSIPGALAASSTTVLSDLSQLVVPQNFTGTLSLQKSLGGASVVGSVLGQLTVSGNLAKLSVGQNVSGAISVGGSLGPVTIGGLLTSAGAINAHSATTMTIGPANTSASGHDLAGKFSVSGALATLGVSGDVSGLVQENGPIQSLYVGGSVNGTINAPNSSTGSLTTLTVGKDVSGAITVSGSLSTANIGGSETSTGMINAANATTMTIGVPNTPATGHNLAGKLLVSGTLGTLSPYFSPRHEDSA